MSSVSTSTADAAPRTDSLATSVVILIALTVVQRLVGFVRSVLFCRWLDVDQLGQWDLAFGFLMLAAPLAQLGIPGSFGRYVEHYRQNGQLRTFLRRTALACGLMAILAVGVMIAMPQWFSEIIFGRSDQLLLVVVVGATLASVIAFNYLTSLFMALRQFRIASSIQFSNTVLFAAIAIGLLVYFPPSATSVVMAFGLASIGSATFAAWRLLPYWKSLAQQTIPLPGTTMWGKLLPFAFWLWMMNWISNVFETVDRFMIVHYSGLADTAALDLVGQYHSARLVPVLLIGVAEMLSGMITPYLSGDWEAGRRDRVSQRLNTISKMLALAMVVGAAIFLCMAPWLFGTLFKHKFAGGLDILPLVLMACIWTSTNSVMNNYLWCAEKSHHLSLTMGAGLILNIVLNWLLLPAMGLHGVAIASAASKALSLGLLWWVAAKYDWKADRGLLLVMLLPLLLPLGPMITLAVVAVVAADLTPSLPLLRSDEQVSIKDAGRIALERLKRPFIRRPC
jgi:PST family polysaccharide transporter